MITIRAIVRPEKADEVLATFMEAGYLSVTKYSVAGHGKRRGIKIGEVTYDETPKTMIMGVIKDEDKDFVIDIVMTAACFDKKGHFGDGNIFINEVQDVYTILVCDSFRAAGDSQGICHKKGSLGGLCPTWRRR